MFSHFYREVFGLSAMKTSACLSKLISITSQIFFLRKRKSNFFLFVFFWILGRNISKLWLITWWEICPNCLVSVQRYHLGIKFWIIFFFCDDEPKKFGLLAQKTAGLIKLLSTSPQEHFEEKSWRFGFFWSLNGLFSNICLKTCGNFVRTALYVPREAISRKQVFIGRLLVCFLFSDFYRKAVELSAKKNRQVCQNFILLLHKNILRKKINFVFFWCSNGFFSKFWQKTCVKSVGTAFYCSTGTFWGNKLTCFSFFGAWMEFSSNSS